MLKINCIKIEISTTSGDFGAEYKFSTGLNIVKGENTSGKSTIFQTILYGLGMEQLLGGTNEKTMQSAVRDTIEFPKDENHSITKSCIFLEIQNGSQIITIQRFLKGGLNSKLIRVHKMNILSIQNGLSNFIDTWIHDAGGANNINGFHSVLEKFMGWELPDVLNSKGEFIKLYIQTIFPAFVIEQKSGWSDFLATIPIFGIRNAESRAVEFLLKLDTLEEEQKKQQLKERKNDLQRRWRNSYEDLNRLARKGSVEIDGIENSPQILSSTTPPTIFTYYEDKYISLIEFIEILEEEYNILKETPLKTTNENVEKNIIEITSKQNLLNEYSIKWELLSRELKTSSNKKEYYEKQLEEKKDELRQNKDAQKIIKLGGQSNLKLANNTCPYCEQEIQNSLFTHKSHIVPLDITGTISYIEAQIEMIKTYVEIELKISDESNVKATYLYKIITELRKDIRQLKTELTSDERLPSVAEIEKRIRLEIKIKFYLELAEEIAGNIEQLKLLSKEWKIILENGEKLPKYSLSLTDASKLDYLQDKFKSLLLDFGYSSKGMDGISVSKNTERRFLLPVVNDNNISYNIRFDSSGSDFIRTLCAYYCALFTTSQKYETNHPQLLILDEPIQQDISPSSINALLKELETYSEGQAIIFASFHQKEEAYNDMIKGVTKFTLINIEIKSIKPINN